MDWDRSKQAFVLGVWTLVALLLAGCGDKDPFKPYRVAGLQLELPADPQKREIPIPEAGRDLIAEHLGYQLVVDGVEIHISRAEYKGIETNLEGAVQGSLGGMKAVPGVTDFTSEIADTKIGALPARRAHGSYRINGRAREFDGLYFARGSIAWFVLLDGQSGKVETLADRVLESVAVAEN